MAFVNEELTPEQREEFAKRNITNPQHFIHNPISPHHVTVDWDNESFLIEVGGNRDYPNGRKFLFLWKNKDYWIQFDWALNNGIMNWFVPKEDDYFIPTRFPYHTDPQFIYDVKEALMVFGINGITPPKEPVKINF